MRPIGWSMRKSSGLQLGLTPRVGSIAVFPRADGVWAFGVAGHVAFVNAVSSDASTFNVTYENFGDPTYMYTGTNYNVSVINEPRFQAGLMRFIYLPIPLNLQRFSQLAGVSASDVAQAQTQSSTAISHVTVPNSIFNPTVTATATNAANPGNTPNGIVPSAATSSSANGDVTTAVATYTNDRIAIGFSPVSTQQEFNADLTGTGQSDLLLYNRAQGNIDVFKLTPPAGAQGKNFPDSANGNAVRTNIAAAPQRVSLGDATTPAGKWGSSLDIHIGDFSGEGKSQILLYDRVAGTIQLLSLNPDLTINHHVTIPDIGTDWEMYVGRLSEQRSGLFMYKRFAFPDPTVVATPTAVATPNQLPAADTSAATTSVDTTGSTDTTGGTQSAGVDPSTSASASPTATATSTPTATATSAPTATATSTPTATATSTSTATATSTPTVTPTSTSTVTATSTPTPSPSPTGTPTPMPTHTPTATPTVVTTPTPVTKPTLTVTPVVKLTPTPLPRATATPRATPTPSPAPTPKPTATAAACSRAASHKSTATPSACGRRADVSAGGQSLVPASLIEPTAGATSTTSGDLSGTALQSWERTGRTANILLLDFNQDLSVRHEQAYTLWHANWEVYVGRFVNATQDAIFLYDRSNGEGRLMDFDSNLLVHDYHEMHNLNGNWVVYSGDFLNTGRAQMVLYDPVGGDLQMLTFAPDLSLSGQKKVATFATNQVCMWATLVRQL